MLPRAVCLQLLHPTIARGILEHALMRERIWLHKKRTVPALIRIAYTDREMRRFIQFAHEHVKGTDEQGRPYHALNPDVFHFQHATFVETLVTMVNTFIGPLDADEHERLYQDCCEWYRRYGISDRPMPGSWADFTEWFSHECNTVLSAGPHFEPFRDQIFEPTDWWPRVVPRGAIRAMQHPWAVELTGVTPSASDRLSLRMFAGVCRAGAGVAALRAPAALREPVSS
ncbi:DUF2236 domain-containing protein [Mycolicibacterium confluentis]|nr:DUF2236 domain-containing protein [Mycolicibacterium confluentis]